MNFKKGDRIKYTHSRIARYYGKVGTVLLVKGDQVCVCFDDDRANEHGGWYSQLHRNRFVSLSGLMGMENRIVKHEFTKSTGTPWPWLK